MSSKIDFNILLAQADKNTNKAHKLLEEKKLLNKQSTKQKPSNPNKVDNSKQSALAFIQQKKEEIRKRNEQEARELLERKKEKDAINNPKPQPKKNGQKQKVVSSDAVQKYLNSKKNNSTNQTTSNTQANKKPSSNVASNNIKKQNNNGLSNKQSSYDHSKSYYDQIPSITKNSNESLKTKQPNINKSSIQSKLSINKPPLNNPPKKKNIPSAPAKPAMSYDQILKMAETCHKDKASNPTKLDQPNSNKTNDYRDLYFNNNSKNQKASSVSSTAIKKYTDEKKRPEDNKPKSSNAAIKAPVSAPVKATPAISSWDKIVSDMKKKPVKKIKQREPEYTDKIDYDDEEDEYDSEMDDFLDDDSEEDTGKESYSKEIREIFKYDPKRYKHINLDDCDNMETDFHSQMKEEKASLRLGIQEDIREMKIEAEMERKKFKKRHIDTTKEDKIKKVKS